MRYAETIIIFICCFFIVCLIPLRFKEETKDINERSLAEKQLTDLEYKIQTRKQVDIGDFVISAEIEAYDGDSVVSYSEIIDVLQREGTYYFKETYVRITYNGETRCVRVN